MENNNTQTPPSLPADNSEGIKQYMQTNGQRRKDRKWLRRFVSTAAGMLVFVTFIFAMGPFLVNASMIARYSMAAINLRWIGKALEHYQRENNGKRPPNLELLVTEGYSSVKMFTNPVHQSYDELKIVDGKFVGEMGYVFFLDIPEDAPSDAIVGYGKGKHELLDYVYALTLNGSIAKLTPEELNAKLKSQGRPIADFKTGE